MENSEKSVKMQEQEFEKKLAESGRDELNVIKTWLFKENIRLQMMESDLKCMEDKLQKERKEFQSEMAEAGRKLEAERMRLKQEEILFDKKLEILKNGFAQLDADRRQVERDRLILEADRNARQGFAYRTQNMDMAEMLFQGVNSHLTLKKRYKDLIKMFHPDNLAGDHEMVLLINRIYEELRQDYETGKRA